MLISGESLRLASLETAKSNHLLFVISHVHTTLIWVLGEGDHKTGLILSNNDAGLAFRAAGNPHWSGIEIGPIQVRVDPRSANARKHRGAWRLEAAQGSLSVRASVRTRGLKNIEWLPVAGISTPENTWLHFDGWTIGMPGPTTTDWSELVRFEGGKIVSNVLEDEEGHARTSGPITRYAATLSSILRLVPPFRARSKREG
jgi:hypothetical protein